MTTRVWRITHRNYRQNAFNGEGARLYGGRFNSEGLAAVYTSGSLSLSLLELLVQVDDQEFFKDCVQICADIPDRLIYKPESTDLPQSWSKIPYGKASQVFGDEWIKNSSFTVMRVPSVVVSVEFNYVINPNHQNIHQIDISKAEAIAFDPRLK